MPYYNFLPKCIFCEFFCLPFHYFPEVVTLLRPETNDGWTSCRTLALIDKGNLMAYAVQAQANLQEPLCDHFGVDNLSLLAVATISTMTAPVAVDCQIRWCVLMWLQSPMRMAKTRGTRSRWQVDPWVVAKGLHLFLRFSSAAATRSASRLWTLCMIHLHFDLSCPADFRLSMEM